MRPDGTIAATYYYDSFGNITDTTGYAGNSITYAGYQYDSETGLYYLKARMYDPGTARFLQEDTYTGDPGDPLSLNLYTYCHNEPIMYGDPNGHKEETAIEWLCNWLSGKSKKKEGSETEKIVIKDWGTKEDEERWNLAFEGKTEEFRQAQKEKYEELVDEALVKPVKMVASIAIGFTPADIVKDSADFIEGKDTFTGDPMSRWAMGAMLFLPEAGDQAVRQIAKKKAVKSIAKKAAKNVIDDVIDYADIAYTTKKVSDIDLDLNLGAAKKTQYTRSIVDETDDIIKRTGVSKVTKGAGDAVRPYQVGTFDELSKLSKPNDGLEIHHVVQKHPAGQIVDGYEQSMAPSIALPRMEHRAIPNLRGDYSGNARGLLSRDIRNLRNYTDASNSSLRELINLNKEMYPDAFRK